MNEGKKSGRVFITDGRTVGWKRKEQEERERDLIFSSVIQSSEVLALPLRLYDTVMLGSE